MEGLIFAFMWLFIIFYVYKVWKDGDKKGK